mmetsp:Transcript_23543/g.72428  ORF Transcript_23543/g.72428 Transcript_23543/m.72428 type:complete len:188 (+) Transcript_23543:126-689(+)
MVANNDTKAVTEASSAKRMLALFGGRKKAAASKRAVMKRNKSVERLSFLESAMEESSAMKESSAMPDGAKVSEWKKMAEHLPTWRKPPTRAAPSVRRAALETAMNQVLDEAAHPSNPAAELNTQLRRAASQQFLVGMSQRSLAPSASSENLRKSISANSLRWDDDTRDDRALAKEDCRDDGGVQEAK